MLSKHNNIKLIFSILCIILSVSWWCLFPLVSLSTGEVKPRRLFVDEHAYHISAISGDTNRKNDVNKLFEQIVGEKNLNNRNIFSDVSFKNVCEHHDIFGYFPNECYYQCWINATEYKVVTDINHLEYDTMDVNISFSNCIAVQEFRSSTRSIKVSNFQSRSGSVSNSFQFRSTGEEAVVIAIPWYIFSSESSDVDSSWNRNNKHHDRTRTKFAVLIGKLIERQKWLSKPVIIQHVPILCDTSRFHRSMLHKFDQCRNVVRLGFSHSTVVYSELLALYLADYHATSVVKWNSVVTPKYLIRDVYVIDFEAVNKVHEIDANGLEFDCGEDEIEEDLDILLGDGLLVTYSGINGQVPNMDIVTMVKNFDAKLSLYPSVSWMGLEKSLKEWIRYMAVYGSTKVRAKAGGGGARRNRGLSKSRDNQGSVNTDLIGGVRATSRPPNVLWEALSKHFLVPLATECSQLLLSMDPSLEYIHRLVGLLSITMVDMSHLFSGSYSNTCKPLADGSTGIVDVCPSHTLSHTPPPSLSVTDGLGLHGQYIAYNVDAITLKTFNSTHSISAFSPPSVGPGSKTGSNGDSQVISLSSVLTLTLGMLRGSSNLYGKLCL